MSGGYRTVQDVVRDIEAHPIESGGHIYHPIPFPEFDHLTTAIPREESERKLRLVDHAVRRLNGGSLKGVRVLDIGANGGFYTFHLAREGARLTAFEGHPQYGAIGDFLATQATGVDWHPRYFGAADLQGQRFDTVLMLSVFQWISQGDKELAAGLRLLREVSRHSSSLVFELGFNSGKSAVTTPSRNHVRALYHLLRDNTEYQHHAYVASTRAWKGARHMFASSNQPVSWPGQWRKHWPPW